MANSTLSEAYQLIKGGDHAEARATLKPYLKANPTDPKGWWLYANAGVDSDTRRESLERVVKLDPSNDRARQALAKMSAVDDDEDFYDTPSAKGAYASSSSQRGGKKSSKSNDNLIIAIVVGLGVIGLIAILIIAAARNGGGGNVTVSTGGSGGAVPGAMFSRHDSFGDIIRRGNIGVGEIKDGNVDTFDDDAWVLTINERQAVTIAVAASSVDLDPQLYVYGSNGRLIAENDDIEFMSNTNSRVELTLGPGQYGIVVSAFGSGGPYRINVR